MALVVALVLGAVGAWLLGANVMLLVRALVWPRSRHISGIPLLGGIALAVAMGIVETTRPWCWVPVVVDPMGVVAIGIAIARPS